MAIMNAIKMAHDSVTHQVNRQLAAHMEEIQAGKSEAGDHPDAIA
jgi:hypothetical protein